MVSITSHSFAAPLWQIIPHTTKNRVAILLRRGRKVAFTCLDFTTGRYTSPVPLPEKGQSYELVGFLKKNFFVFHRYDMEQSIPAPAALVVYDGKGGLCWELPFAQLLSVGEHYLEVQLSWQGRTLRQVLIPETGSETTHPSKAVPAQVTAPQFYGADSPYFEDFKTLLREFGQEPVLGVDYLEWQNAVFLSFYTRNDTTFRNHFWGIDEQKELFLQKVLYPNRKGRGQNTFWRFRECLLAPAANNILLEIR